MNFNYQCNVVKTAFEIVTKIQQNGFTAYFVGGCVRDTFLGKDVNDVDIATSALPIQIKRIFKKTYDIGVAFGIVNVVENGINFEVATFRKEDNYRDGRRPDYIEYTTEPMEDAQRRDFTINAMFFDPVTNELFDFFNGQKDLEKGILNTIGRPEDRFREDYLRILRAVRFTVRFDFQMDDNVYECIFKYKDCLKKLSVERIREELNKIFTGSNPDKGLQLLSDLGILKIIIPELENLKGVKQPEKYHPEGDVFVHTKLMLSHMAKPTVELAWSVLLHDIGKPDTLHIDEDGQERFFCHEIKGAEIAEKILKRLKFSNNSRYRICHAVKNHMRFASAIEMKQAKWKKLMFSDNFPMELELHRLDVLCSNKKMDNYNFLISKLIECKGKPEPPIPFITGCDLIQLGIPCGPIYKKILNELHEMQISGSIKNKDEAFAHIKRVYVKE